ncbi:L-threonylcarbamoyladenylate synthase [Desemzia sp. FAM 23991]|uniref:L-threonylcarbamoyladenylate synthase n=1 Tax=unclassified Desemzia TaxID=2685243 RepID=UPI003888FCD3
METKLFHLSEIKEAAAWIKKGELISFPTETVYGLGADAKNEQAVQKVYQAKGRPSDNPLIVHIASKEDVQNYVKEIPAVAETLMDQFWPGPLTLIFKVKESVFANTVTAGLDSVAIRMPNNEATLELIKEADTPLVGPSANTSGKPSPTTAMHVYHDLKGKIAGILDDGETGVGLESTVLDITDPENPTILRPGGISKTELEEVIGFVSVDQHLVSSEETPKAPGMKYKHYSPNEPVIIVDGSQQLWESAIKHYQSLGEKVGLMANESIVAAFSDPTIESFSLGEEGNIQTASHRMYAGLRHFEKTEASIILAEPYPETGLGIAYMNRLKKAAANQYYKNHV